MSGRYKILEELGQGGAGSVSKAYDTQLDRYVALKRLLTKEEEQQQDSQSSALRKEAASLATLQHPNIVSVYDLGSDENGMFIVMELLEGETLSDLITGESLGLPDFYELATQTLEGALSAHAQSILHRDLKPENMKVKRLPGGRLQVKIVDFGLARLSYGAKKQTEDQGGNVLGSIFYMAPEQFLRRPLDGRTDLYSLGCVYYQALSGRRPFEAPSMAEVMDMHLKHEVTLLHDLRPDLPESLCDWVMWLMNVEPDRRPENAQTALDSLRTLAAQGIFSDEASRSQPVTEGQVARPPSGAMPARRTSSHVPTQPSPEELGTEDAAPSGRKKLWLLIGGGIVLVAGVAGYFLTRGSTGKKSQQSGPAVPASDMVAPLPGSALIPGAVVRWTAGQKMDAWGDNLLALKPAKAGDPVLQWRNSMAGGPDYVLTAVDQRLERCPSFYADEAKVLKGKTAMVRFKVDSAMFFKAEPPVDQNFPFGKSAKEKGYSGLSLFMIVRPNVTNSEICCASLRSPDGKGWLKLLALPSGEFQAKISVRQPDGKQPVKVCKVPRRDTRTLQLLTVRWNPVAGKLMVMSRAANTGTRAFAEVQAFPGCPALSEIYFSEAKSNMVAGGAFAGDILEFILWPFFMDQDQHADMAQKLAEQYFKTPGSKW